MFKCCNKYELYCGRIINYLLFPLVVIFISEHKCICLMNDDETLYGLNLCLNMVVLVLSNSLNLCNGGAQ